MSPILPLARALLALLLPPGSRDEVLGDLDAEYASHVRPASGRLAAHAWYLRQVLGSVRPALAMRRRLRRRVAVPGPSSRRARISVCADQFREDLRLALRTLSSQPSFTAVAVATFALGIGANTAIFSVVDAVLLKPLPYASPDTLVRIWSSNPRGIPRNTMSPADFFDIRDALQGGAFESLSAFAPGDAATLQASGGAERITASMVSPSLFHTLGVLPVAGRTLQDADSRGGSAALVISERLSRLRHGSPQSAVGAAITVDGRAYTVAGVMPIGFGFPSGDIDVWTPMPETARNSNRSAHFLHLVGRLAPGVAIAQATEALQVAAARLANQHPETNKGWGVTTATMHESAVGEVRRPLLVLLAAVGCVLLIACANVAGLMLARGSRQARDVAIRTALGATRARIVRQQLVESAVLAFAGGGAGLILAWVAVDALRAASGIALPRASEIGIDTRVLCATALISLATGLGAGILPGWRASGSAPEHALKHDRGGGPARGGRARTFLVAAEIALMVVLTIASGLLIRSFGRVVNTDAGFDQDRVLLASVTLAADAYEPARWASYAARACELLAAIPGVTSAGAGAPLPLSGQAGLMRFGVTIENRPPAADGRGDRTYVRKATPGFFDAMGIPIRRGRPIEPRDTAESAAIAVVDETFVARYLPGGDPIGRRIRLSNERRDRAIVGVAGAVRQTSLEEGADPHVYLPHAQSPAPVLTFAVRASGDPRALAGAVRERLLQVDPARPVYAVRTLEDLVAGSVAARRFNVFLLVLLASLAGVLTMVGVYAAVAHRVTQSTAEIGVRLALGATRGQVLRLFVGRSLLVTGPAALAGVLIALVSSRYLSSMLFEVAPTDPVAVSAGFMVVIATSIAASYLPARRALQVDPASLLRRFGT